MKKRQIKKINQTAMRFLIQLEPRDYQADMFSVEEGLFSFWFQCGGLESEWDCEPAFEQLQMYLGNTLSKFDFVETGNGECPVEVVREFVPDLSTAKKVFHLAKKLLVNGCAK